MQSNVHDHVLFASPKNQDERFNVAGACVRRLGIKFPALVDGFDNRVETAYTGWPDRLYLIAPGFTVRHLTAFNGWLRTHGSAVLAWVFVVVGGIMVFDGIYGFVTGRG